MKRFILPVAFFMITALAASSQQVADTAYSPVIVHPAYAPGSGPSVYIDEGHNNFHTKGERYWPFARLLERDGYRTAGYTGPFTEKGLEGVKILVISNALNEFNVTRWYKPVKSAFTPDEVRAVRSWVERGGALMLIADHMPFGGAAAEMADAFGVRFTDGFAVDTVHPGPAFFIRKEGTLGDNIITRGRNEGETVDTAVSFTGQAFTLPPDASSILTFPEGNTLLLSDTAWVFDASTTFTDIKGWSQAAFMTCGRGRVVVCGEAAMFSAQLAGPQQVRAGMNSPMARQNYRLLLNIIHWLDGLIK